MGSSYIIPNVGTMTSTGLTDTQLATILQSLFVQCLGIDPTTDTNAYSRVRIDWPVPGQPGFVVTDDVAFIRVTESDEPYNAAHEVQQAGASDDDGNYVEGTIYTRVWGVNVACYGPNSYDHIRQIKACLYQDFTHDILASSNLYVLPVTGTPSRNPEFFDSQWWPRTDFQFSMYEEIADGLNLLSVKSVEIIGSDEDGNGWDDIVISGS